MDRWNCPSWAPAVTYWTEPVIESPGSIGMLMACSV